MMAAVTPTAPNPAPIAVRSGADLRAARERLGRSLTDIAAALRIRLSHLEALEEGHITLLPGNAYAMGYVRAYARVLGLDAEDMVRRFKAEAAEVGRRTDLVFPVPMPDRGLPAGAVMLLGLVLAVGAYAGWYRLSGEGRLPAEAVTAIPERLASLAEQALPPPVNPATDAPIADLPIADAPAGPAPRVAAADPMDAAPVPPVPVISPTSAAAAPLGNPIPDEVLAPAPPPATQAADVSRIVLHASADAWIQVKDRSGGILLNRTMKAGETWPVPRQDNLLLTTGNAGGTDILLDGAATPSLGASGTVRRDMPLDPDLIKDGKLSGALAPQLVSARTRP